MSAIWILEDDPGCQFVYEEVLSTHKTTFFPTLSLFLGSLRDTRDGPDLIIADIKLPDGSFLDLLASDEKRVLNVPFLVVSSVDELEALRLCFDEGALDYITKPFKKGELIVKTERILQSGQGAHSTKPSAQSYPSASGASASASAGPAMPPSDATLSDRRFAHLTLKEQKILQLFLRNKDHQVSRAELVSEIWADVKVHHKTLDVHLYNLRKKIKDLKMEIRCESQGVWRLIWT
jgi:DNA-binding response OmpR family regulator